MNEQRYMGRSMCENFVLDKCSYMYIDKQHSCTLNDLCFSAPSWSDYTLFEHPSYKFHIIYLQQDHVIVINVHFDEHRVVANVIQRLHRVQRNKLLRAETGVALPERAPQERLVLLAHVGFDGVRDVPAGGGILALVNEREGAAMTERPGQECVVLALADADEDGHEVTFGCDLIGENIARLEFYSFILKEYYEIVDEARPLSGFFPTHADFFTDHETKQSSKFLSDPSPNCFTIDVCNINC